MGAIRMSWSTVAHRLRDAPQGLCGVTLIMIPLPSYLNGNARMTQSLCGCTNERRLPEVHWCLVEVLHFYERELCSLLFRPMRVVSPMNERCGATWGMRLTTFTLGMSFPTLLPERPCLTLRIILWENISDCWPALRPVDRTSMNAPETELMTERRMT